jgi:hypothetical protein
MISKEFLDVTDSYESVIFENHVILGIALLQ